MLDACIYKCYFFLLDLSLDHYVVSFLVSCNSLYLEIYFVWYEYGYSSLLLISFCMEYLLPSPHFQSLCVPRCEVGFLFYMCVCVCVCLYLCVGNDALIQYSCLENPMNRAAWRATVHLVAKSWTWLKQFTVCVCVCIYVCWGLSTKVLIHSASLCLLVEVFNLFTFKIIIHIYVLVAIVLIVLDFFL